MNKKPDHSYSGGCACENISLDLKLTRPIDEFVARTCGCSFCKSHGAVYVSDPHGIVTIESSQWDSVEKFQFGSNTADFLICSKCQTFVAATSNIEESLFSVININCLKGIIVDDLQTKMVNFEGKIVKERLNRRALTWTPVE